MFSKKNTGKSQVQRSIIDCTKFNIKNFVLTEFDTITSGNFQPKQHNAFLRYLYTDNKTSKQYEAILTVQTPFIKLTQGGMPPINGTFTNDDMRGFINVPLDPSQEVTSELRKIFSEIDNYNLTNKSKILGDLYKKSYTKEDSVIDKNKLQEFINRYVYYPIIKTSEDRHYNKKGEVRDKYDYFRVKIDKEFNVDPELHSKKIKTKIYINDKKNLKYPHHYIKLKMIRVNEKFKLNLI